MTIEEYDLDNKEEMLHSLESCFSRKDGFLNGCRILQNMDYELIKEIDPYRYVAWLTVANRLKDQYMERLFEGTVEKFEEEDGRLVFKQKDFFHLARELEEGFKRHEDRTEGHLKGKIEYLNAEIARLSEALEEKSKMTESSEKIKEIESALNLEKEAKKGLEQDLSELLEEFKLMKDKFEDIVHFSLNEEKFKFCL